jgi:MoaA/NifB/PqqE/SkfB family radical SAM enzyme
MTNAAVLLYTMRCNINCAHCSVDSHPQRDEKMDLQTAIGLVAGLADQPGIDFIDISGGEPMLFRRELLTLAKAAYASSAMASGLSPLKAPLPSSLSYRALGCPRWACPLMSGILTT